MNKNFKKFVVMALAGLTLCGTAMAAPRPGHRPPPRPAPIHHRAHAPRVHIHHHSGGWVTLGAVAVGALIGGIIGACR